jgi:hypothetical protein
MFATRVFSFVAVLVLAFAGIANAVPSKRQASAADVQSVLTDLQSTTSPILDQMCEWIEHSYWEQPLILCIATLVDNDEDTDDTIEPLVNQLGSAFDDASSSLSGLQRRGLVSRQDNDDVAQTMADIISVIFSWHSQETSF